MFWAKAATVSTLVYHLPSIRFGPLSRPAEIPIVEFSICG
jgi:hypothetical protein